MTGYGKGEASHNGRSVKVELKSVNHRFLDLNIKMPRSFNALEDVVRKNIQKVIERGHVEVYVSSQNLGVEQGEFQANYELAKSYFLTASMLSAELGIENDLAISSLVKVPEIIERKEAELDEEETKTLLVLATVSALAELEEMRIVEGTAISKDMLSKVENIKVLVAKIEKRAPFVSKEFQTKMKERIAELVNSSECDETRLAQEIAIFADHCSIDEEITRLKAHISHISKYLNSEDSVGRKIDFLVQEFNREANTIGSKANDLEITQSVLALKNEIEKLREQACNLE